MKSERLAENLVVLDGGEVLVLVEHDPLQADEPWPAGRGRTAPGRPRAVLDEPGPVRLNAWMSADHGSTAPKVLVVDDEQPIVDLVAGYAEREGWQVRTAGDGVSALDAVRAWVPDVVVLDLMLPGMGGLEVCVQLRTFSDAYVVMLTARTEEVDRIVGLTVGADDYLAKPFSPRELVARINALLRRPRRRSAAPIPAIAPGLEVDEARRTVTVDGRRVELTALEFNVLAAVTSRGGAVATRQEIYESAWGEPFLGDDHLVDVHVANVRRKLGDDPASPRFIETLRGVGYRAREGQP